MGKDMNGGVICERCGIQHDPIKFKDMTLYPCPKWEDYFYRFIHPEELRPSNAN